MAEGNSVNDEKKAQRQKFKTMTRQQKLSYIRTYYLAPGIVVFLVLVFALWFFLETVVLHKDVLVAGCTINVKITDETYDKLTDGLLSYLGGDSAKEVANLSKDNYVDYDSDEVMEGYMDQTMLFTQIAAGEFSYMVVDESALCSIYESGYLADLNKVLGKDYIDSIPYDLYKIQYEDGDEVVGIYLKDTSFACDSYLVIANFVDPELAKKLIDYIVY